MPDIIQELYKKYLESAAVCTDTRRIVPGSIFFALKGDNFNGNKFAEKALREGCRYAVVDEKEYAADSRFILVDDVLTALQELAKHHRKQLNIPVLAITGSNGKTTTKELVNAVLRQKYKTYATIGNLNNHIGVPLTLLAITPEVEFAIIEMGANHQREIAFLCDIAQPGFGLITNIGKAHLEGFGGIEGVKKGKGELYDFLRKHNGKVFLNKDSEVLAEMAKGLNSYSYGTKDADVTGEITAQQPFLQFRWSASNLSEEKEIINTHLIGHYNFYNLMAAATIGTYFEVEKSKINAALASYTPDNNRSQVVKRDGITFIMDAYNANPTSMEAAIANFAGMPGTGKVLFLGDMLELGEDSAKEHQHIADMLKQQGFEEAYLVGGQFSSVQTGFKTFPDAASCVDFIKQKSFKGKTLLFKGSRGIKLETVVEAIK